MNALHHRIIAASLAWALSAAPALAGSSSPGLPIVGAPVIGATPNTNLTVDANGRLTSSSSTALGVATATSLALNGATIGSNALAVTGTSAFSGFLTVQGGALAIQTTTGTAFGVNAGAAKRNDATGSDDVFIGYVAGQLIPAGQTHSTIIGAYAGSTMSTSGQISGLTLIGQKAGETATQGTVSVCVGGKSCNSLPSLLSDTMVGYGAGFNSNATNLGGRVYVGYDAGMYDSGDFNIMVGYQAGPQAAVVQNPVTGSDNIGIGKFTLNALKSTGASNGIRNIVLGTQAGNQITTASQTTAIGFQAAYQRTTGNGNIHIGPTAGYSNITGNGNIFLGENSGLNLASNASNYFIAGSGASGGAARIDNVHFGKGYQDASPTGYTIWGTGAIAGTSSNIGGGNVKVSAGIGTGSGTFSTVKLDSPCANGGTATTAQTMCTGLTIFGGYPLVPVKTVGTLPSCSASYQGARALVTDANATTYLSTVASGGSNIVPVVCDGTNWKIGALRPANDNHNLSEAA